MSGGTVSSGDREGGKEKLDREADAELAEQAGEVEVDHPRPPRPTRHEEYTWYTGSWCKSDAGG